jgi:hypothetical protein
MNATFASLYIVLCAVSLVSCLTDRAAKSQQLNNVTNSFQRQNYSIPGKYDIYAVNDDAQQ